MNPRPVSVLQVLGHSAGGIARHVAELASSLGPPDLRVQVTGPPDLPVRMPDGLHHVEIPDGPVGHRQAIARIGRLIEELKIDVVHAHGLRSGIDAGRAARRAGRPVVVTVHNLVHPDIAGRIKAPIYGIAENLAVRYADRVFCVSQQIADHLVARVPAAQAKIEVLYLGVSTPAVGARSTADIRSELGLGGAKLIVTASRLSAQKDLSTMLLAVARIPDVHLAVLGEGPRLERHRQEAGDLGIADRVHLIGFRTDVTDYLRAADVFCLSSIWEGVPLAAQEAILVDTPVVATAVGGMPELIRDGVSGRLVPPGDAGALASALGRVLDDVTLAKSFAAKAKRDLLERFSRTKMLERLTIEYLDRAS